MEPTGSIQQLALSDPGWEELAGRHPAAGIFHHPAWIELLAECYGYRPLVLGLAGEGGRLRAGIPCMEIDSPVGGKRWAALPFSDHCTALARDPEALRGLAEGIAGLSRDGGLPRLEVRGELPAAPGFQPVAEHVLHRIELGPEAGQVLQRAHRMHRRNIRIAQAGGVEVVRGETRKDLGEFYRLHLITRRRQGVPIQPWRFFELLGRKMLERGQGFVLLAYKGGHPLAGAVFLHWKGTLTYKYGASCPEGMQHRANPLILWEAIQWACRQGCRALDLGRTSRSNAGLRLYKSRWGARESALVYTRVPAWTSGTGWARAARLLQAVLRRSPPWACRLAGELLYRHCG